ncbi:cyclic nucleotide-binding domain-containing protein [Candidatus Nitrospira bockiana]
MGLPRRSSPSCEASGSEAPLSDLSVRLATSDDEREAIYRLRYDVYIEEMNGADRHLEADPKRRLLRDPWDERAHHFYVEQRGEIVACARLIMRADGPLECEEHFDLERFAPAFPDRVSMTSRLVLHPGRRGSHLLKQLTCAMYEFVCERGQQFNFIDCHTRLLPLYSRLGFRPYRPGFNHVQYTYVVPMVLVIDDLEYLEQVRSPFVPIARRYPSSTEGRALLLSRFPDAAVARCRPGGDVPAMPDALLERLMQGEAAQSEMLSGLTVEDVRLLASLGHYVSCRTGDAVLRAGDPGRELFLILDGRFNVTGQIRHSGSDAIPVSKLLRAGDIFGEIRFLTEEIRYASVVAEEDSTLLVLNAKAMDRLVTTAPKVAAKVFRNIARIVVARLCPAAWAPPQSP